MKLPLLFVLNYCQSANRLAVRYLNDFIIRFESVADSDLQFCLWHDLQNRWRQLQRSRCSQAL